MALPSTVAEMLEAVRTSLAAITWPAAIDADEPLVFVDVVHSAAFPFGGDVMELSEYLAPGAALAVVTYQGSTYPYEEMPEIAETSIGVGIVTIYPGDRTATVALMDAQGLHGIVTETRKALRYSQAIDDSLYLAQQSAPAVLTANDDQGPGRSFVALELTFRCQHQDVVPS